MNKNNFPNGVLTTQKRLSNICEDVITGTHTPRLALRKPSNATSGQSMLILPTHWPTPVLRTTTIGSVYLASSPSMSVLQPLSKPQAKQCNLIQHQLRLIRRSALR